MTKQRPYRHLAHAPSFSAQPVVFFTCVIEDRRSLLANHSAHTWLRDLWEKSAEHNDWFVGNYVLMPDHVHLFARPGLNADPIPAWIGMWKSVSSRYLARQHGVAPPIWQQDYFDRYLRSTQSYEQKWEYVRANPVRAGLAKSPDDWPFQGRIHLLHL